MAIYAPIAAGRWQSVRPLVFLYLFTLMLFAIRMELVSMDVSLLFAASVGAVWPLIGVIAAFFPLP
ncbi:MAG: hypothetical protein OEW36_14530 [Hylemonella sp.]|nr:hypothetical protein [Hylemonella sp.]